VHHATAAVSIEGSRSPVSLSPGDEVPHMFTRKPRLQLVARAADLALSDPRARRRHVRVPLWRA